MRVICLEYHSELVRLPVAPLLACDTAKVLDPLTAHEPLNRKLPETSGNS